ncbi:MAG: CAAX prenyl protease-related protein [Chthonomonadales bacterium]|nr:CAAX prenyl protease-related protein [Chthonomonadales bacterium]
MSTAAAPTTRRAWPRYVVPMALFLALTAVEAQWPAYYAWLYIAKVLVVGAAVVWYRDAWHDMTLTAPAAAAGAVVGLAVFAEWILVPRLVPYPTMSMRVGFDPWTGIADPALRAVFLAFRFAGLVVLVPVMEELFWRSFLLRYFTTPRWSELPIGQFSWQAFWIVAGGFGVVHPEWLPALVCAMAYALLLRGTRSLGACVVAHAVTNLALGIYIVVARAWAFW